MRVLAALVLAVTAGCTPGGFGVYVLNPNRRPIVDARASLYDGLTSDVCAGARPIAVGTTDVNGIATGNARWCGDARLIVTARGYRTLTRELDTCERSADGVHVELQERPADPPDSDPMVKTARLFLTRASGTPLSSEAPLSADSGAPTPQGGLLLEGTPCDLYLSRSQPGSDPSADFEFQCEGGCRSFWRVHMVLQDERWRVRELSPITSDGRDR
jgi:hypothetical protein